MTAIKKAKVKAKAKTPASRATPSKSVIDRIREVVVVPTPDNKPVLVTPLPVKEVRDFGKLSFEAQASLVMNTFPLHEAEIVGTTNNSGAGSLKLVDGILS